MEGCKTIIYKDVIDTHFTTQETYDIIYSLHNLSNIENSVHFELLKYGILQLINFLFIKPLTFHLKEKNFRKVTIRYLHRKKAGGFLDIQIADGKLNTQRVKVVFLNIKDLGFRK